MGIIFFPRDEDLLEGDERIRRGDVSRSCLKNVSDGPGFGITGS